MTCYVVLALGGSGVLANSDVLCEVLNVRSPANAPEDFAIQLNQSMTARLTWQPNVPVEAYLLVPSIGAPLVVQGAATSATYPMTGPTCFVLVAVRDRSIAGNSDALCGVPGVARGLDQ